jgi:hypothetical protein
LANSPAVRIDWKNAPAERIHHDTSSCLEADTVQADQVVLAFGVAHISQRRERRSAKIGDEALHDLMDHASFLPSQPTAFESACYLVLRGGRETDEGRKRRAQIGVCLFVQILIRLQAAQNEEQLAKRISFVSVSGIAVVLGQRSGDHVRVWKVTSAIRA